MRNVDSANTRFYLRMAWHAWFHTTDTLYQVVTVHADGKHTSGTVGMTYSKAQRLKTHRDREHPGPGRYICQGHVPFYAEEIW